MLYMLILSIICDTIGKKKKENWCLIDHGRESHATEAQECAGKETQT